MENKKETVCAVVVTYNRKELLLECLEALRKQTRPVQSIYLIDNASTDGTPVLLLEKGYITELPCENLTEPWEKEFEIKNLTDGQPIKLHYVRMHENTGGAGGFHEGVKRGYEKGYDWLWLMDDDTIVLENTLLNLFRAKDFLERKEINFAFLSSVVLWLDNTFHKMNIPSFYKNFDLLLKIYTKGLLPIRTASFVSLLFERDYVEKFGFPYKDYFIWNDDIEYTLRLSNHYCGFLVLDSCVYHKTQTNYSTNQGYNVDRFFYAVRNKIWLVLHSSFHGKKERAKYIFVIIYTIYKFLKRNPSLKKIVIVFKGCWNGLLNRPKI